MLLTLVTTQPRAAPAATSAEQLRSYREHMSAGAALFLAGRYEEAARTFDEAYVDHPFAAFLFNAGLAYERQRRLDLAVERFRAFIAAAPNAADAAPLRRWIADLEVQADGAEGAAVASTAAEGGAGTTATANDGVANTVASPVARSAMKSILLVETVPPGAPVTVLIRTLEETPSFVDGQENPGWQALPTEATPVILSLDAGRYHVIVGQHAGFAATSAEVGLGPARVLQLLAKQGAFMALLRVDANVRDAYVFLDDAERLRPEWGTTPHAELVQPGRHRLSIEAPGYQPFVTEVVLPEGGERRVTARLECVDFGIVRLDANLRKVQVEVDGQRVGTWSDGDGPLEVRLPAGSHRVSVSSRHSRTLRTELQVQRGKALPVHAQMAPALRRGAAWTQAILSAVVVGASIAAGVESNRLYSELEEDRDAGVLDESDPRLLRGKAFAIGADVGLLAGGVLGVLAAYNFIRGPVGESRVRIDAPVDFGAPSRPHPPAARGDEAVVPRHPDRVDDHPVQRSSNASGESP